MDRMKKICLRAFVVVAALVISLTSVYAADENKEDDVIQKTYTYISDEKDKKDDSIKMSITYEGKNYVLKDISYESKPIQVIEKVKTNDKTSFPKSIEKVIDGKKYTLKANDSIKWSEEAKKINLTHTIEYATRAEIPEELIKDDYTFKLKGIEEVSRSESFTAPAIFISYSPDATEYLFNGKRVEVRDTPIWEGYENDIKAYLGVNGSEYNITGGSFTSDNIFSGNEDGHYERTANYTGTRLTNYYSANFAYEGNSKTDKEYSADVIYEAEGNYEVLATVFYEPEMVEEKTGFSMTKLALTFGVGIAAISGAAAAIIYLLKKKSKSSTEEKQ